MGKEEVELKIRLHETLLKKYIELSQQPFVDKARFESMIEKIRLELACLYAEKESYKH